MAANARARRHHAVRFVPTFATLTARPTHPTHSRAPRPNRPIAARSHHYQYPCQHLFVQSNALNPAKATTLAQNTAAKETSANMGRPLLSSPRPVSSTPRNLLAPTHAHPPPATRIQPMCSASKPPRAPNHPQLTSVEVVDGLALGRLVHDRSNAVARLHLAHQLVGLLQKKIKCHARSVARTRGAEKRAQTCKADAKAKVREVNRCEGRGRGSGESDVRCAILCHPPQDGRISGQRPRARVSSSDARTPTPLGA